MKPGQTSEILFAILKASFAQEVLQSFQDSPPGNG